MRKNQKKNKTKLVLSLGVARGLVLLERVRLVDIKRRAEFLASDAIEAIASLDEIYNRLTEVDPENDGGNI